MGDTSIANGETEQIINRQDAEKIISDEHDARGFMLYTDGNIRLVREEEKEQARHGHPIQAGMHMWDLDPNGKEMYAYNDASSGSVTVSVTLQKWSIGDMG